MSFITHLSEKLEAKHNETDALSMAKYMRNKFLFLGVKSPVRKTILKEAINKYSDELKNETFELSKALYAFNEREYHYCAIELYARFKRKKYHPSDIKEITFFLSTYSHRDTVDFLSRHVLGQFLLEHPIKRVAVTANFSKSQNIWLNRAAILFQLGYKSHKDGGLLFRLCEHHSQSDEFFIKKAIGWALREYSKIKPEEVIEFTRQHHLKALSKFEALRLIS